MRRADIASGVALTLLGLITIFVIVPMQISGSSDYGIAPDVFPLTLLWTATALAALLVVARIFFARSDDEPIPFGFAEFKFVSGMAVFLAALVAVISAFGFIVGGIAAIALLMLLMGERRHPIRLVLVSALTPTILFFVFWNIFRVPLP